MKKTFFKEFVDLLFISLLTINLCDALNIDRLIRNSSRDIMVENWPNQWNNSVIPYAFNFFSPSPKRLLSHVQKGHKYIEERSCLTFKEQDPRVLVTLYNFTYIYYSYSGVLENCCLPFFSKSQRRRLVLITPLCTLPAEVAHATLHAMGLRHKKHRPFSKYEVKRLMFFNACDNLNQKLDFFENKMTNTYYSH
ncbi:unnamed protein product, partial [Iphiclides podalirius]